MGTPFQVTWIDKDAATGPVFRIHREGFVDTYSRERQGQRVLRLKTRNAPPTDYVEPAVQAFRELAAHWGGPIVFVIDPDVSKPPAAAFLYEWSRRAFANGSVDQSYMVMSNTVTVALGKLVCRMFVAGGMPIDAVKGDTGLAEKLSHLDLSLPRQGWSLVNESTALVLHGQGAGAPGVYSQLFARALRRLAGRRNG